MSAPLPLPEPWTAALAAWSRTLAREGIAPRTVETRRHALRPFALAHPDPWTVTAADVSAWLDARARWAAIDPKRMRSALHRFYLWGVSEGFISVNPAPVRGRTHVPLSPAWDTALADFRDAERDAGRAASTLARRVRHLDLFATTAGHPDPWAVAPADMAAWVRAQDWAASTATAARSALRAFYAWGADAGRIATNPAAYLTTAAPTLDPRPIGTRGPVAHPTPAAWTGPLRLFGRHMLARGRSPRTVQLRDLHLRRIARDLDPLTPWDVTLDDLLDWFAARPMSAASRRTLQSSVRAFYAWAVESGHLDHDPARTLPAIRQSPPSPHPVAEVSVRAAIAAADPRERLMIRMGAELGMRRAEIAQARTSDLFDRGGHWSLLVHGKGSRDRVLPLPDGLAATIRAMPAGYLFPSDASPTGHLSPATVGKLLGRLLPDGVSAHALRHRFATRAYALDRDIFAVQRLLGHASPETTQRYVASADDDLRSTVDRLAMWTESQPRSA